MDTLKNIDARPSSSTAAFVAENPFQTDFTEDYFQYADHSENRYQQVKNRLDRETRKAKNSRIKYQAVRFEAPRLAKMTEARLLTEGKTDKAELWAKFASNVDEDNLDKKEVSVRAAKKRAHYNALHEFASNPKSDKYKLQSEALLYRDAKKASLLADAYARESSDRSRNDMLHHSSARKAAFWYSEAAEYDHDKEASTSVKGSTMDEVIREDRFFPDRAASKKIVSRKKPSKESPASFDIENPESYRDKAVLHEAHATRLRQVCQKRKHLADMQWLMYNAEKYCIPRFALKVSTLLREAGDDVNADYWWTRGKQLDSIAYTIPDTSFFEEKMLKKTYGQPGKLTATRQERAAKRGANIKKQLALELNDSKKAVEIAHQYKTRGRMLDRLRKTSTKKNKKAGAWLSKADEYEEKAKEQENDMSYTTDLSLN